MASEVKEGQDIVAKVEMFLFRIYDHEYVINERAKELIWEDTSGEKGIWGQNVRDYPDCLNFAMRDYEINKNNPTLKWKYATKLLYWIQKMFANGLVDEGKGLVRKLAESEQEKVRLEEEVGRLNNELQRISSDYLELQGAYKELEKRVPSKKDDVFHE